MQDKTFAYYESKGQVFILPIVLLLGGIVLQNYGATQKANHLSHETAMAWICYLIGLPALAWAFTQLKSPPVFSGNKDTVTFQPSPFFPSTSYSWAEVKSIFYHKTFSQIDRGSSVKVNKSLTFEMTNGQKELLDLSRFELSFEELHQIIVDLAPHIQWIMHE